MGDRYQEKSNSVYVGSLSYNATEDDLANIFDKYGQVSSVKIITDKETGKPRGFGFVSFENPDDALAAVDGANGTMIGDRSIQTQLSRPRKSEGGGFGGSRGYSRGGGYDRDSRGGGSYRRERGGYSDRSSYGGERNSYGGERNSYGSDRNSYGSDRNSYGHDQDRDGGRGGYRDEQMSGGRGRGRGRGSRYSGGDDRRERYDQRSGRDSYGGGGNDRSFGSSNKGDWYGGGGDDRYGGGRSGSRGGGSSSGRYGGRDDFRGRGRGRGRGGPRTYDEDY